MMSRLVLCDALQDIKPRDGKQPKTPVQAGGCAARKRITRSIKPVEKYPHPNRPTEQKRNRPFEKITAQLPKPWNKSEKKSTILKKERQHP